MTVDCNLYDCVWSRNLLVICNVLATVDGGWSEWEDISECTASCGPSLKEQNRSCSEPSTSCGGLPCIGNDHRFTLCDTTCCLGLLVVHMYVC